VQDGQARGIDGLHGLRGGVTGDQDGGDLRTEGLSQGSDGIQTRAAAGQTVVGHDDVWAAPQLHEVFPDLIHIGAGGDLHVPTRQQFHHRLEDAEVVVDTGHQDVPESGLCAAGRSRCVFHSGLRLAGRKPLRGHGAVAGRTCKIGAKIRLSEDSF